MTIQRKLHESYETSCRVLLDLINKERRPDVRQMMMEDFTYKAANMMDQAPLPSTSKKISFDVAIVTIIENELRAAKLAFGVDPKTREDDNIKGLRFWHTTLKRKNPPKEFSILITMVGEARNVPCATACDRMFNAYDVKSCFLIGVAAGLKGEVSLGDVVAADIVLDYEHQRLEPGKRKKRPKQYEPDPVMLRSLHHFAPNRQGWQRTFQRLYTKIDPSESPFTRRTYQNRKVSPSFKRGVILAGEKLIADGSLPQMQEEYHNKIVAVEEEGSGFCYACREQAIPWLVFRGISDYGDPSKKKNWQITAALAAATAARTFILSDLRTMEEVRF